MTSADALRIIKTAVAVGRLIYSDDAGSRMAMRNVTTNDVEHSIATATACVPQEARDAWALSGGVKLDGEGLTAICAITETVVVIALM